MLQKEIKIHKGSYKYFVSPPIFFHSDLVIRKYWKNCKPQFMRFTHGLHAPNEGIKILGRCGRQNMLPPYLRIWDWELIFGPAVKAISSLGICSPWFYRLLCKFTIKIMSYCEVGLEEICAGAEIWAKPFKETKARWSWMDGSIHFFGLFKVTKIFCR